MKYPPHIWKYGRGIFDTFVLCLVFYCSCEVFTYRKGRKYFHKKCKKMLMKRWRCENYELLPNGVCS